MRSGWLVGLLLCGIISSLPVWAADPLVPAEIRAVSEVWDGHTNADGTGLGWDVLRKVFEPAGFKVLTKTEPYTRSIGLVMRGKADVWLGSYAGEVDGAVYPKWKYDFDRVYALGLSQAPVPSNDTIGQYRLFWVRGYDFQDQLPNISTYREIQRRDGVLDMLQNKRADFYIDAIEEIDMVLSSTSDKSAFRITQVAELPLYLGFSPNERGRELAALFDQRMAELVQSGELKPIFAGWKKPYPFGSAANP
jgi:polar amino acid transport system substrate-binding protein